MICCPLLSILRTRKTPDRPLGFGEDLRWFAISDIVESRRRVRRAAHAAESELRDASYAKLYLA